MATETTQIKPSTLSDWAAPYVTNMLGRAEAFSNLPFQPYEGALTAGPSTLQSKAFEGIGSLTVPTAFGEAAKTMGDIANKAGSMSYTPTTFTNTFNAPAAYTAGTFDPLQFNQANVQQYMNPYLQSVLDPQLRETQRQAEIARNQMQSRMAQAGAYGGSRQAIMEAEAQRNLMQQLGDITGKGYATAFEDAARRLQEQNTRNLEAAKFGESSRQFGSELGLKSADLAAKYGLDTQKEQEAAKQYAARYGLDALSKQLEATRGKADIAAREADYGLKNLEAMLTAGKTQRDIDQAGLAADYEQYIREQKYPQEQLEFLKRMVSGLPIQTTSTQQVTSPFEDFVGGAKDIASILKLFGLDK